LKLIRAFLNAGVMENGLVSPSVEGTPQGGPLSPLLSNLVLDELDRELGAADIALSVRRTTVTFTFAANARVRG
jgi:retron-type reverse transcriptase